MVSSTVLAATISLLACAVQDRPASFEVASVKLNTSGSGNSSTHTSKSQFFMENVTLRQTIETAFDVKDYSLSGPPWLDSVRFDVVAKLPPGAEFSQIKPMLQTLLAERFQLSAHREPRTMSAFALVVDKKGSKLQAVEPGIPGTTTGRGMLRGKSVSMAQFADMLSSRLDRPVKDLTALAGVFNIQLEWTPDEVAAVDSDEAAGPSIFAAIQAQLGLKLEARKLPVDVLVIDHLEKVPTEN